MSAKMMSLDECRRRLAGGQPLKILDVRTPAEFATVHAVGARLMPLDELNPAAVAAWHREGDEPLAVICQAGARAAKACQRLEEAGFANVYCVQGGTDAWERNGLPVERDGGKVISLERQVRIGAGALVLVGAMLAWLVHPAFIAISIFIGGGLVFAGITDYCGMAMLLGKMPWNRRGGDAVALCATAPKAR